MANRFPTRPTNPGRSTSRPNSRGRKLTREERLQAVRRKQKLEDAAAICDSDIGQYSLIFEAVLKKHATELSQLEDIVAQIDASIAQQGIPVVQPPMEGCDSATKPDYLEVLKMAFEDVDETIFETVSAAAEALNLSFYPGPPKDDLRAMEKARLAYGGRYDLLKDLRRASIACANIPAVRDIVEFLADFEKSGLQVIRVKNRFDRSYDVNRESAGYRDLQLILLVPDTGLIWELQVHLEDIEKLRTDLRDQIDSTGRTGHQRYIAFRSIRDRVIEETSVSPSATPAAPPSQTTAAVSAEVLEMATALFQEFDRDGNGSLDTLEFQTVASRFGKIVNAKEAVDIMKNMDKNGDGTIDLSEFANWLADDDDGAADDKSIRQKAYLRAKLTVHYYRRKAMNALSNRPKLSKGRWYDSKKVVTVGGDITIGDGIEGLEPNQIMKFDCNFFETTAETKLLLGKKGYRAQVEMILSKREGASSAEIQELIRLLKEQLVRFIPPLAQGIDDDRRCEEFDALDIPVIEECPEGIRLSIGSSCANMVNHMFDTLGQGTQEDDFPIFEVIQNAQWTVVCPSDAYLLGFGEIEKGANCVDNFRGKLDFSLTGKKSRLKALARSGLIPEDVLPFALSFGGGRLSFSYGNFREALDVILDPVRARDGDDEDDDEIDEDDDEIDNMRDLEKKVGKAFINNTTPGHLHGCLDMFSCQLLPLCMMEFLELLVAGDSVDRDDANIMVRSATLSSRVLSGFAKLECSSVSLGTMQFEATNFKPFEHMVFPRPISKADTEELMEMEGIERRTKISTVIFGSEDEELIEEAVQVLADQVENPMEYIPPRLKEGGPLFELVTSFGLPKEAYSFAGIEGI